MFLPGDDTSRASRAGAAKGLVGVVVLSLSWACGMLQQDLLPGLATARVPRLEREALPLVLLSLAAGVIAFVRGSSWPRGKQLGACVLVGFGLFLVPALLVDFAEARLPALARTALFTLVPMFAVVFEPHIGTAPKTQGGIVPALVGVAGALFVFPLAMPDSASSAVGFSATILAAGCIAAANCFGVALAAQPDRRRRGGVAAMAMIAGLSAAIGLTIASLVCERPVWEWNAIGSEVLWSAAIETPGLLLLFWLMPRLSATRMAARYLLAPLLAILIGVALLRSTQDVHARSWFGLILMASSTIWLLFAPDERPNTSTLQL